MGKRKTNNFRPMLSKSMKENQTIICMDYKDVEPYLKKYNDVLDGLLKELLVVKSELEEIKRMINDLGGSPGPSRCKTTTKRNGHSKRRWSEDNSGFPTPIGGTHNE